MDRAWIVAKLKECLELRVMYEDAATAAGAPRARKALLTTVNLFEPLDPDTLLYRLARAEPTIREIFRTLDPQRRFLYFSSDDDGHDYTPVNRDNLERAIGLAQDQEEWATRLAPEAPALVASHFHPWVWASAQPFWQSSLHRAAVQAAAVAVTANTQAKVGRTDIFDDDLMSQVFTSDQPKPGKPRLRLPGDHTDRTVASRQRALMPFAQGCYAGIRNVAAHEHGSDWTEQRALQSLACLSVLAGWIDECDVVTQDDPAT